MKIILRALVFLALLFLVVYVSMNNTHSVDFFFPALSAKKLSITAAILFFAFFAIGVLAGTMLTASNQSSSAESAPKRK